MYFMKFFRGNETRPDDFHHVYFLDVTQDCLSVDKKFYYNFFSHEKLLDVKQHPIHGF